ncbi:LLM class flavin-dependent oxidoreductase [Microbacterium sp. NPDC056044]|uniref:LLM class flavin-dependent oxidoreductase n=1 Tax=Microbacterium sp. NPDC056044 TaxID=3345690 RepID=UPI0035DFADE1
MTADRAVALDGIRRRIGPVGLWAGGLTRASEGVPAAVAVAAESAGFGAVWGGEVLTGRDIFDVHDEMLRATASLTTATGIANMRVRDAATAARQVQAIHARHPSRFIAGFGTSHRELTGDGVPASVVDTAGEYLRAVRAVSGTPASPPMLLAALGPRMLRLSAEQADGAHTYFASAAHTAGARAVLGRVPLLVPQLAVVLGEQHSVPDAARRHTAGLLAKRNYARHVERMGLDPADGDAVARALVAAGDADAIAQAVAEHLAAGADHVAIQLLGVETDELPAQAEELAMLSGAVRSVAA